MYIFSVSSTALLFLIGNIFMLIKIIVDYIVVIYYYHWNVYCNWEMISLNLKLKSVVLFTRIILRKTNQE